MCTGITVTMRYVPRSRRINIAGLKLDAHTVITMETSSVFLRSQGFPKALFLKDGLAKHDISAR